MSEQTGAQAKSYNEGHQARNDKRYQNIYPSNQWLRKNIPTNHNEFFTWMKQNSVLIMQYENLRLQKYAKELIPLERLKFDCIHKLRDIQKEIKCNKYDGLEPCYKDLFLVELVNWFNTEFFEWINIIPCKICGRDDNINSIQSNYIDKNGIRVEVNQCCGQQTRFYRYNDIKKLLLTRKGRCGEYANCFTFLCHALGYDSRLVYSQFDHVWTEVYSTAQKRWIHIDPSENVIDAPLMYQHGWKRHIDYIIAFSIDDVQDVTWRYTSNHKATLSSRNTCTEYQLLHMLLNIRSQQQSYLSNARKIYLRKRGLFELVELMTERSPTESEKHGRSSGSLAWRKQRGETYDNFFIFELDDEEIKSKQFNLRYSACEDKYERYLKNDDGKLRICSSLNSWKSCIYSAKNILKKIEKDWKIVYLAREEGSNDAEISWKFDFTKSNLKVKDYSLKFETRTFENGKIQMNVVNNFDKTSKIIDSNGFTIIVQLRDGTWQHTQLFRQNLYSIDFPFDLNITFY